MKLSTRLDARLQAWRHQGAGLEVAYLPDLPLAKILNGQAKEDRSNCINALRATNCADWLSVFSIEEQPLNATRPAADSRADRIDRFKADHRLPSLGRCA